MRWLPVLLLGCASPSPPASSPANVDARWQLEPIATTEPLVCVGAWHDGVWAETRSACGHAFERVGDAWIARPEVYNCYQLVPEDCHGHGEWSARDGSLFWIHGTRDVAIPELASDRYGPIVLEAPGHQIPFTVGDVWGTSARDVFAVGDHGAIVHFDGTTWTPEPSDTDVDLRAIRGADDAIYAVGARGTVLRRHRDGQWRREPAPTEVMLNDVATTRDGWFAVGDNGVVLHHRAVRP